MWQAFLTQQHLQLQAGRLTDRTPTWGQAAFGSGFVSVLGEHGLLQASGADAAKFLHNQLSNDVENLTPTAVRRAAYCTPKGRMLASLVYWRVGDFIHLQLSQSLLAAVQKRLSMFIMRSQATLTDISPSTVCFGLGGSAAAAALQNWFPVLPSASDLHISNDYGTLLRCPDAAGVARYQWWCPLALADAAWSTLQATLTVTNSADWNLSEISAGIATINALTSEKFVPQMVNFELIGGVNFRKGCYPGQEIVARSQYLGKLKRRTILAEISGVGLAAGAELFKAGAADQPCGAIVNVEALDASRSLALLEMTLADQQEGQIHCGSPAGPLAQMLSLPYEIADITR